MLGVKSSKNNIPEEYLFSQLEWKYKYDLLMSNRTLVITEGEDVILLLTEEYRCNTVSIVEAMHWDFLKELCKEEGKTVILAFRSLEVQHLTIMGILGFLRIDYYWAGPETLSNSFGGLFNDENRFELEEDLYLERTPKSTIVSSIDEIPGTSGIILVSDRYFQENWVKFSPLFLRENYGVILKDNPIPPDLQLTIEMVMRIALKALGVLRRLTEKELVEILGSIPTIAWNSLPESQQYLFLYGVEDISTYIALQNHYLRHPVQRLNLLESSSESYFVLLETMSSLNLPEKHSIEFDSTQISCSCTPYSPAIPCIGIILFVSKFQNHLKLPVEIKQIRHWLKGIGAINGLLHLGLILRSTAKRQVEYKFEGNKEIFRYELTKSGARLSRYDLGIDAYFRIISEFSRRSTLIGGDDFQAIIDAVLPLFPGNYTFEELLVLRVTPSFRTNGALKILYFLSDLSFKYGMKNTLYRLKLFYYKIKEA